MVGRSAHSLQAAWDWPPYHPAAASLPLSRYIKPPMLASSSSSTSTSTSTSPAASCLCTRVHTGSQVQIALYMLLFVTACFKHHQCTAPTTHIHAQNPRPVMSAHRWHHIDCGYYVQRTSHQRAVPVRLQQRLAHPRMGSCTFHQAFKAEHVGGCARSELRGKGLVQLVAQNPACRHAWRARAVSSSPLLLEIACRPGTRRVTAYHASALLRCSRTCPPAKLLPQGLEWCSWTSLAWACMAAFVTW